MNILTEIWGEPSAGKTHSAIAGWPNPLLVDTAFTSMGFREIEVEADPDEKGESWPVLLKLSDYDESAAEQQYRYLDQWPDDLPWQSDHETVVLDNAADLRVIAANEYCRRNDADWPRKQEWGKVNDMIDSLLRRLKNEYHVVVISQMKDEYVNDAKTGEMTRDGPKRMDHRADIRIEMSVDDSERTAIVQKNRFMDPASEQYGAEGSDLGGSPDLASIMALTDVPSERW